MKLIYSGSHDAVEVPDAGIIATRDVPVEVPEKFAASLLEQDTWSEAKADVPAPPKEKAGK